CSIVARSLFKLMPLVAALLLVDLAARAEADKEKLPPDLGTRKTGVDWTAFLGPTADSKSPETGLTVPWPADGPRVVWHRSLGTGYGMPSVSRGRLFAFSRFGKSARLECMHAETAEELWHFDYDTAYEDLYGYDTGPRCQPVVDGARVY